MLVPNVMTDFISIHKGSALSLLTASLDINGHNMAASFLMDLLIKAALPLTAKENAANANLPIT
jgi:hypothetical protein